jgi:hypothetical protein
MPQTHLASGEFYTEPLTNPLAWSGDQYVWCTSVKRSNL